MPDISMCRNEQCKIRTRCYRAMATPNPYGQSVAMFGTELGDCKYYWPLIENGLFPQKKEHSEDPKGS